MKLLHQISTYSAPTNAAVSSLVVVVLVFVPIIAWATLAEEEKK